MVHELRGATRCPLVAAVEIVELGTGARISARTSDLSLTGCYVDTLNPLPSGTDIKLQIIHQNGIFTIRGSVAHSTPNMGMGIKFATLDRIQQKVLQGWLDNLNRIE